MGLLEISVIMTLMLTATTTTILIIIKTSVVMKCPTHFFLFMTE